MANSILSFIVLTVIFLPLCSCANKMQSAPIGRRVAFHANSFRHGRRIRSVSNPKNSIAKIFTGTSNLYLVNRSFILWNTARTSTSFSHAFGATDKEEENIYNELTRLTTEIQQHDHLYYTTGLTPLLSDDEYDALTEREAELCKRYPELLKRLEIESGLGSKVSRYGGRVGPIISEEQQEENDTVLRKKLPHLENAPMQSLDNAMVSPQVIKWLERVRKTLFKSKEEGQPDTKSIQIIAEPKMDGLSLSLRYILKDESQRRYELEWGATRGDGTRGEDVTEAVTAIEMIPNSFVFDSATSTGLPEIIEVRGEVVLPTSKFLELTVSDEEEAIDSTLAVDAENINDEQTEDPVAAAASEPLLPKQFANARNAASGILLRRKPKSEEEIENTKVLRSYLGFYAYSIAFSTGTEEQDNDIYYEDGIQMRNLLNSMGFNVPSPCKVAIITLKEDEEFIDSECKQLFDYHSSVMSSRDAPSVEMSAAYDFDFDVDGAVYKLSSVSDRLLLGASSRYPRWAIAHKFPAQCAVTKLQGVEIQIGRTGALTPVAVLDPVDLGGVTVSRASLHNFEFAQSILRASEVVEKDHTDIGIVKGASVMISRAGDVIPQVLKRLEDDPEDNHDIDKDGFISLLPPTHCPECGSETVFDIVGGRESKKKKAGKNDEICKTIDDECEEESRGETRESTGQVLRCGGAQLLCRPRAVGALSHAFSRAGLDITGLSEARLQQLLNATLIRIPSDLFDIIDDDSAMFQNITELPGWGNKSALNLQTVSRKVAKEGVSLSKFIYSLGIRHIGVHSSSLIAAAYGSSSAFLSALEEALKIEEQNKDPQNNPAKPLFPILMGGDDNEGVKGIGPVQIESLISFAKNEELLISAKSLAERIIIHDVKISNPYVSPNAVVGGNDEENQRLPFNGKSVVFTGSLPNKMTRIMAQDFAIELLGATGTPSSVSKATALVVVGEKGGKKAEKAKDLGIEIMSAEDFVDLIEKYQLKTDP